MEPWQHFLVILVLLLFYFIPSFAATINHKRTAGMICVLNLFFGWTVVVWFILLAWGRMPDQTQPVAVTMAPAKA